MKIAIGIPVYGDTKSKFTQCLASMLAYTYQARIVDKAGNPLPVEIETFMISCSMLTQSRHILFAEAVNWEADYLLCLDADHIFPKDTLVRLLSHGLAVVGCNYPRRDTTTAPTAAKHVGEEDIKNLVYTTQEKADAGEVEEVDHIGLGVCLIDMRIIDLLQAKAEEKGEKNFLPLFKFEERPDASGVIGEDVFFFRKVREAGVSVNVDHALSWDVGHIHERILTNAHAVAHKERWAAHNGRFVKKYGTRADELEAA